MKKLLLTGVTLFATLLLSYGQSVMTSTSYSDDFNDNLIASSAEDGWYTSAVYTVAETGGQLDVTATNADKLFEGFGLYLKPTTKIDVTGNKKVEMTVTNTHPTQDMRLRVDLRLRDAAFTGPNCPTASGDTISVNMGVTNALIVPANTTQTLVFDYSAATPTATGTGYEYNTTCGGAWTPTVYQIPTAAWTDVVGLYMVINGGATEGWCNPANVCGLYSDNILIDNLKIGGQAGVTSVNKAAENIASSKLFPNPVSDIAKVELNLKSSSDVKVTLTDLMGREVAVVAEGTMTSLEKSFDVSTLTKGLYTVNYFINGAPAKAELLMVK